MAGRVLLTGISGFLGGHVALALLRAGHAVRGSVRDARKADTVRRMLAAAGADISQLDFVTLDLLSLDGWREAMADIRYLQHTASPFPMATPKDRDTLLRPAMLGTEHAISAALAGKVERIVLTSSMAAIAYGHPQASRTFTAADWTDLDGDGISPYTESKTRAERRAWELVRAAGRERDLVAINPSAILGPLLDDDPGTSVALIGRLLDGAMPAAPRIAFGVVDVRDVAELHVTAMTAPAAGGRRLPISADTISLLDAARSLAGALPDHAGRLPRFALPDWLVRRLSLFNADIRANLTELGRLRRLDASAATALLGHDLIPATDAILASAESLIARGLLHNPRKKD